MSHRLSWKRLLSEQRSVRPDRNSNVPHAYAAEDERTAFEQDYDRIVFSKPFRRLARKTQVHPFATNDHIHNRLTHSIEVASVGKSFARRLCRLASERSDLRLEDQHKIPWILQTACLIHDLGNPPFGHAGEEVARVWSANHAEEMFNPVRFASAEQCAEAKADWLNFEGNAQGFRLAVRPDNPSAGYLRMTHATLGAAMKYPWISTDPRAVQKRKHNVYTSEKTFFKAMADDLGLSLPDGTVCRHPLSFLTEAADDICYRIIDLEDAVEMGIVNHEVVRKLFLKIVGKEEYEWMRLPQLRGQAIRSLIDKFWAAFETDYDAIMNGERTRDLRSSLDEETRSRIADIKQGYETIFGHPKKLAMEIGAYQVLGRILQTVLQTVNAFHDVRQRGESYDDVPYLMQRCAELAWGLQFVRANFDKPHVWWLEQMKDFVSGMTDDYASALSSEIAGHRVVGR